MTLESNPELSVAGLPRLDAQRVASYLIARGAIDVDRVVLEGLQVQDVSRRNRNFRIQYADGSGLLLKQAPGSDAATFNEIRCEARILKAFSEAPAFAELAPHVPRYFFASEEDGVVATELVVPGTSLTKYHLNGGHVHFPDGAGETTGKLLGLWHRTGEEAIQQDQFPDISRKIPIGLTALATQRAEDNPEHRALFEAALDGRFQDVRAAFQDVARGWFQNGGVCHGDIRMDNFLLTAGEGTLGGLNLKLIDWEIATRGDPMWDVAQLLADYGRFWAICAQVRGPTSVEEYADLAPHALGDTKDLGRAFWDAYVAARHLDADGRQAAYDRLLELLPLAYMAQAWENLANVGRNQDVKEAPLQVLALLDLLQQHVDAPAATLADWFGITDPREVVA